MTAGDLNVEAWRASHEEGLRAFPGVSLGLTELAAHAARVAAPDPTTTPHGPELFLACACAGGDAQAIAALERHCFPVARAALARFTPSSDFVEEVLQELRTRLFVGPEPRIGQYAARGPLQAWIRVAASRLAIDLLRSTPTARPPPDDDAMVDVDLGPEVHLLREVYREAFREILARTLNGLSPQDRNLLRRHLLDRLTLQELAAPYSVHPATIARRLASLRQSIADSVREGLAQRHREEGGSTSLESLARAIRSEIDLSLSPLLSTAPDSPRRSGS